MPYVEPSLVVFLLSHEERADVIVPVVSGYYEPLCAVYQKTCLEGCVGYEYRSAPYP